MRPNGNPSPVLVKSVPVDAQQSVRQGGDSLQLGELTFRLRQVFVYEGRDPHGLEVAIKVPLRASTSAAFPSSRLDR